MILIDPKILIEKENKHQLNNILVIVLLLIFLVVVVSFMWKKRDELPDQKTNSQIIEN